MDYPVGISHQDEGKKLCAYLDGIRKETEEFVNEGKLILGCDSSIISNKTAAGNVFVFN